MFNREQSTEIIQRRHQIVLDYCEKMGWEANPSTMTIDQIMEIRATSEWRDVPKMVLAGAYDDGKSYQQT